MALKPFIEDDSLLALVPLVVEFGVHRGRTVEELILKAPDYIQWILKEPNPRGQMVEVAQTAKRLIGIFDAKPFVRPCGGSNCNKPATRCVMHRQSPFRSFLWCDDCDTDAMGPIVAKLRTFRDVTSYVALHCSGRKTDLKDLVRELARAKGLPDRVGVDEAIAFFGSLTPEMLESLPIGEPRRVD